MLQVANFWYVDPTPPQRQYCAWIYPKFCVNCFDITHKLLKIIQFIFLVGQSPAVVVLVEIPVLGKVGSLGVVL
jgi:hypothetical protein